MDYFNSLSSITQSVMTILHAAAPLLKMCTKQALGQLDSCSSGPVSVLVVVTSCSNIFIPAAVTYS